MATIDSKKLPRVGRRAAKWTLIGIFVLLGSACDEAQDAAAAAPYEVCNYGSVGELCGDGPTRCTRGMTKAPDGYCTQPCKADADCVQLADYEPALCEQFYYGRMCAVPCTSDDDCPEGTSCVELERVNGQSARLCQPK